MSDIYMFDCRYSVSRLQIFYSCIRKDPQHIKINVFAIFPFRQHARIHASSIYIYIDIKHIYMYCLLMKTIYAAKQCSVVLISI